MSVCVVFAVTVNVYSLILPARFVSMASLKLVSRRGLHVAVLLGMICIGDLIMTEDNKIYTYTFIYIT